MDSQPGNGGMKSDIEGKSGDSELTGIVMCLNYMLPDLDMPTESSEADIRACLLDGTVLCCILNKLRPDSVEMGDESEPQPANIMRFLSALDRMGLPKFDVSDLEQGSLAQVFRCLLKLKADLQFDNADEEATSNHARKRWNLRDGSTIPEASALTEAGNKFYEVFCTKKGVHQEMANVKISDLLKWNSLDKAPIQLLFKMVDKVLDESFEGKNGDVPHRVACQLRKLVREIERRTSSQQDKIKNQNILAKSREGKFQLKVRALETLATGASQESQVATNQLRQIKTEKTKLEEKKKRSEQDVVTLMKELDQRNAEIMSLQQEMEEAKASYENHYLELENKMNEAKADLHKKIEVLNCLWEDSKNKMKELEELSETQIQRLKKKELRYRKFIDSQSILIQRLRGDVDSVRREVQRKLEHYPAEFQNLGLGLKELVDAAENYHMVLSENRRLYNEVQDLKGNIRVYCRIRPFLRGQSEKQTTIDFIGENGELAVTNPLKQGKDTRRSFKFNKVFARSASQEEVFKDTQPLIRSVLDGYNVCIFAYGQTGSGKTYTMSGPDISSQKDWGVNYRALHDLFHISQNRKTSILYEVGVQMVEIYNEQVRDLLASDGPQKRLGIWNSSQPNGLAVPEASMHPVRSTNDVMELMSIGLMNRAVGATASNERSSRSHSILTVHVRGTDLKSNSVLRGSLHLVDLAGSERVDRTEATGDRLREAQHINKSLSALGDVIFALAQKNAHVPYRNSKLTQVLQSSLGGQAKTLMFVQINPDPESYLETVSTLKFAERVSGVELGVARSNKEGRDVRELIEQVSSLKEAVQRKDEEIERLRLIKVHASVQRRSVSAIRGSTLSPSPSPRSQSVGRNRQSHTLPGMRSSGPLKRITSYQDNFSEHGWKHSETSPQHSTDEFRAHKESFQRLHIAAPELAPNCNDDIDLLGFGDADYEERLSEISDSGLSMGTETDGSMSSVVEYTLFPEVARSVETRTPEKPSLPSKLPKPPVKQEPTSSSQSAPPKASLKVVPTSRKPPTVNSLTTRSKLKPVVRRWQ